MLIEMKQINKSFGSNHVLMDVDLEVRGGEVLALLGENGAGKSTLMNILGGVLPADSGHIFVDGRDVHFPQPVDSQKAGISFIHQELSLIVDLPIYENLFLGDFKKKRFGLLDHEAMIDETRELFRELGVDLDPRTTVRHLDASYKQIVEIARAFHQKASIIIMDEPTAALTDPEIERVFGMIRTLREREVGVIFISHKLNEIMEICDRYTVLRNGSVVETGRVEDTTARGISEAMVGHEIVETVKRGANDSAETVLKLDRLSDYAGVYKDISLSLHQGEILGVTGLLGDGRSELFQTVFGVRPGYSGRVEIKGQAVQPRSPRQMIELGLGYVPRDRKENGILKDMSILDNASITIWEDRSRLGKLDWDDILATFRERAAGLDIKLGSPSDGIMTLSGGNQQKVVLSKWLSADSDILIFDNPTQGVDVGAKEDIYEIIYALADRGLSIIILSSEAQEIIRLCDRALVLFAGRMAGELKGDEMTEKTIMHIATGGTITEENRGA